MLASSEEKPSFLAVPAVKRVKAPVGSLKNP